VEVKGGWPALLRSGRLAASLSRRSKSDKAASELRPDQHFYCAQPVHITVVAARQSSEECAPLLVGSLGHFMQNGLSFATLLTQRSKEAARFLHELGLFYFPGTVSDELVATSLDIENLFRFFRFRVSAHCLP